ncbi:MAG: 23S rRNA methyltransferase [Candidatus Muproteobacteria bacterium RBG_16_64_11]|uniref:Ribosomal RNA large subunit methyltransferase E n=1 Tax=Candidatus Muproteobacteria bacterium RBG_16_64_11 TaxID=1817758 RepID=A0A1F6TFS5_9PROT|nr:MAG: 23S rRNA methyltransferase [Candidatus Muproteobacteria bacterium RBG_16_64_11]
MARTKSSRAWLAEHFTDEYVKRARKQGFRSRAIYKLEEIDARDHLFKHGMTVVDLGAAPGGWSQYARSRVGPKGRVLALDILPIDPLPGVEIMLADFTEPAALEQLDRSLAGRPVDLVISDMAPNISGIGVSDQARTMYLAELALDFAVHNLRPGGDFLVKTFQGQGFNEFFRRLQGGFADGTEARAAGQGRPVCGFAKVLTRKPKASRARSREVYLLARGLRAAPGGQVVPPPAAGENDG